MYAEALFQLCDARGELERANREVEVLRSLFGGDPSLRVFLESPNVRSADRERAFERAFRGRLSDAVLNFLLLVVRRGRQFFFLDMLDEFRALHDAKLGIVHARALSAVPMTRETLESLRVRLEGTLGKRVILEDVVDEEILGGFLVRFDGSVADASLRKSLRDMRASLRNIKLGSELVHED